jgi:hypothetical protein
MFAVYFHEMFAKGAASNDCDSRKFSTMAFPVEFLGQLLCRNQTVDWSRGEDLICGESDSKRLTLIVEGKLRKPVQ